MIHIVAVITAKPGMRETVLQAFRANAPVVRSEPGCIEFGAAVDVEDGPKFQTKVGADAFLIIEKWESIDALKAHAATPNMAAYAAKTKDMIASRVIHMLSPV